MLQYRTLQLYLRLGLKTKKVDSVLEFDQFYWNLISNLTYTKKRTEGENNSDNNEKIFPN